jgi:Mg2+ and Co2+ transporter CorA
MISILNLIIPLVQFSVFLILFVIARNNILKLLAILGMVVSVVTFIVLYYDLKP